MGESRAAPARGEQGARLSSGLMRLDSIIIFGVTQVHFSLGADRSGGCGWRLRAGSGSGKALYPELRASVPIKSSQG